MIKKGDFIKIEYTGRDEKGAVFDSTKGEIAIKLRKKQGPLLIIVGRDQVVKGMENQILNMNKGEEKEFLLEPEQAFGKKDPNKKKIISISEFQTNNLTPVPGLIIQMEIQKQTLNGVVKSVNSGRVLVDYNHPLAGQTVKYKLKIVDVITDLNKKIEALIKEIGIDAEINVNKDTAIILIKKGQEKEKLKIKAIPLAIKRIIPEIKNVECKVE